MIYLRCRGLDGLPFGDAFVDFFDFGDCSVKIRRKEKQH